MIQSGMAGTPGLPPLMAANLNLLLGELQIGAGRPDQARPFLLKAEGELRALKEQGNNSPDVRALLLETAGALGRREEVDRAAAEHISLEGKDQWGGPRCEADVAHAYALLGDREKALPLLERTLVVPSSDALTPVYLRMDPIWDRIRDDPRFQKLANGTP